MLPGYGLRGNQFLWGYKEEQDPELQEVSDTHTHAHTRAHAHTHIHTYTHMCVLSATVLACGQRPGVQTRATLACTHLQVFNLVVSKGINFFDTADSYGTGRLNGKSEQLLVSTCQ